jgi:hypothetical protein
MFGPAVQTMPSETSAKAIKVPGLINDVTPFCYINGILKAAYILKNQEVRRFRLIGESTLEVSS